VTGSLQAVHVEKNSVTVSSFSRAQGQSTEKTYEVARDASILRDGKEVKLADLKKGGRITLKLSPDQKTVVSLSVAGPTLSAPLKSVDVDKNTVTITVENRQGKQDRTYPLARDAKVTIAGKEARLTDLKEGTRLLLTLSAEDGNTLIQIQVPARQGREGDEPQKANNQGTPPSTANHADVPKILDRYRSLLPDEKDLAIFQLDWQPTLKDARDNAARTQRPVFLVVVTNSFGNMVTGHC
jgi:hypothetical protein